MRQISRKSDNIKNAKKKSTSTHRRVGRKGRPHPKYGTSKLEEDFAEQFLDKLKVEYVTQFEAKDIGRFYDFYLTKHNLIIEIDGGYWHSDPRLVKEEDMSAMQKRNKRIDAYKDKWALMHGIPIMRIWEKDIRENPKEVMKELKKRLYMEEDKIAKAIEKGKRHINRLKK